MACVRGCQGQLAGLQPDFKSWAEALGGYAEELAQQENIP